jgi:hypothetical protein
MRECLNSDQLMQLLALSAASLKRFTARYSQKPATSSNIEKLISCFLLVSTYSDAHSTGNQGLCTLLTVSSTSVFA